MKSLSVIIFAFNEADNVQPVLAEVDEWAQTRDEAIEVVFVDDGSSDATVERARAIQMHTPVKIVEHGANRGIGAAIKTGTRNAAHDWVTFMPADGQIDPRSLDVLIECRNQDDLDFVTSVYEDRNDGLHRTVLSWGVRTLIRVVHGVHMTRDGPYLFRRLDFDEALIKPDSFFLNFEFPIRLLAAGKRANVVTIVCRKRMSGRSKSSGIKTIIVIAKDLVDLRLRRLGEQAEK